MTRVWTVELRVSADPGDAYDARQLKALKERQIRNALVEMAYELNDHVDGLAVQLRLIAEGNPE